MELRGAKPGVYIDQKENRTVYVNSYFCFTIPEEAK